MDAQMLYTHLSQIKFVVEAKMEGGSFEDKYIAKFWQKLHVSLIFNDITFNAVGILIQD